MATIDCFELLAAFEQILFRLGRLRFEARLVREWTRLDVLVEVLRPSSGVLLKTQRRNDLSALKDSKRANLN